MKKHISYPKIEQFRNVIATLNRQFNFVGLDEATGEPIYDLSIPKPVLTFKGTVKLHGTNAGVSYNAEDGLWVQSRENIITPLQDNAGFAFFVESNREEFIDLLTKVLIKNNIDSKEFTISIFGEWCGGNIQKGVALSKMDKSFFIFGVKISKPQDSEFNAYWVDSSYLKAPDKRIYNIEDYESYSMDIDFNMPQLVQNQLADITIAVETECPVGKAFGHSGVGEGVVWSTEYKGVVHRFKVKGEKHSASKVRTLAAVDTDKLNSIKEFVEYSVTESRFNQGIEKVFGTKEAMDVKKMGDFLKWIVSDIMTEEMDTMVANGLEPKDIGKYISAKAREMFFATI